MYLWLQHVWVLSARTFNNYFSQSWTSLSCDAVKTDWLLANKYTAESKWPLNHALQTFTFITLMGLEIIFTHLSHSYINTCWVWMTPIGNDIWNLMAFCSAWYITLPQQEKILSLVKYKHHIWHRAIYLSGTQLTDLFYSKSTANHLMATMVLMSLIRCHGMAVSYNTTFHQTAQCVIVLIICEGSLWAVGISQPAVVITRGQNSVFCKQWFYHDL